MPDDEGNVSKEDTTMVVHSTQITKKNKRDFKAEYIRLSEDLIHKAQITASPDGSVLLVNDADIRSFHERILSQIRRVTSGDTDVFESLYKQRQRTSPRFELLRNRVK